MSASILLDTIWKMTWQTALFAALIWIISRLAKRAPAALRHALWVAVLIKFFIPPLVYYPASLAVWQQPSNTSPPMSWQERAMHEVESRHMNFDQKIAAVKAAHDNAIKETTRQKTMLEVSRVVWPLVGVLWLAGVCAMGTLLLVRRRRLASLISGSVPVDNGLTDLLSSAASELGVSRQPNLRMSQCVSTSTLVGLFRPVILLPIEIVENCADVDLRAMFLHELAHIKRRDMLVLWLHQFATVLFFFHPAIWLCGREIGKERELACDELVLSRSSIGREDYASGYVSALKSATSRTYASLAMAEPFDMELRRLNRILHAPIPRMAVRWAVILAIAAGIGIPTFAGLSHDPGDRILNIPGNFYHFGSYYGPARYYAKPSVVTGKGWKLTMLVSAGDINYPKKQKILESSTQVLNTSKSDWWGFEKYVDSGRPDSTYSMSPIAPGRSQVCFDGISKWPREKKILDASLVMTRCRPPFKMGVGLHDAGDLFKPVATQPNGFAAMLVGWSVDDRWTHYMDPTGSGPDDRFTPKGFHKNSKALNMIIYSARNASVHSLIDGFVVYGTDGSVAKMQIRSGRARQIVGRRGQRIPKDPYYGFSTGELTPSVGRAAGVSQGVIVKDIDEDGPAPKSGLRIGDVITEFHGKSVAHPLDIAYRFYQFHDEPLELTVVRDKETLHLTVLPTPDPRVWPPQTDSKSAMDVLNPLVQVSSDEMLRNIDYVWYTSASPVPSDFKPARITGMSVTSDGKVLERIAVKISAPVPSAFWGGYDVGL